MAVPRREKYQVPGIKKPAEAAGLRKIHLRVGKKVPGTFFYSASSRYV